MDIVGTNTRSQLGNRNKLESNSVFKHRSKFIGIRTRDRLFICILFWITAKLFKCVDTNDACSLQPMTTSEELQEIIFRPAKFSPPTTGVWTVLVWAGYSPINLLISILKKGTNECVWVIELMSYWTYLDHFYSSFPERQIRKKPNQNVYNQSLF